MNHRTILILTFLASTTACATETAESFESDRMDTLDVSESERIEMLRKGRVWTGPIDAISARDILRGPNDKDAPAFNEDITCDFIEPDPDDLLGGKTPKFECRDWGTGDKLKIKYDETRKLWNGAPVPREYFNPEVYTELAATRLMWALGFGADKLYPIRVTCMGCPEEPWSYITGKYRSSFTTVNPAYRRLDWNTMDFGTARFPLAATEIKFSKTKIEEFEDQGWSWDELLLHVESDEQRIHREALLVMMAVLQNADAKAEQQRIYCPKEQVDGDTCLEPHLVAHDLGWSFGGGWTLNQPFDLSRLDFERWRSTSVWKNRDQCKLRINDLPTSTLSDTVISEEGRTFAAELLLALTRQQIEDVFLVARTTEAGLADADGRRLGIKDWADAFEGKINEVTGHRCR